VKNPNQSRKRQASNGDSSATKKQPGVSERQGAEQSERIETAGSKERPVDQAGPSDEFEHGHTQLRDYEQVLVERIADVDDDLRATTSRLQRVQQTQHDAIDKRLQRHAWLLGGLMLFAVLFTIAIFLLYRQSTLESSRVAAGIAEMHRGPAGPSEEQRSRSQVRERPDAEVAATSRGADTPQSAPQAPQFADAGSATPEVSAPGSTTDGSDGTGQADKVPEKRKGGSPVVETSLGEP